MNILTYFFKKAISLLPPLNPCSADDLVDNFNLKNMKVVDVIAPYKKRFPESKRHPGEKLLL